MLYVTIVVLVAAVGLLSKKCLELWKSLKKYSPIIEVDAFLNTKKNELQVANKDLSVALASLEKVSAELKILNEDHDLTSAGFYKSKYDFQESRIYEDRLEKIRAKQKQIIKDKHAIVCSTEWQVGGSKAEGKKMTDRNIKLGLSAFNVQCDNEILKVKFDNIDRAQEKISKIRENVDKLLEPNHCRITEDFFKLKLEELFLAYEFQEKLNEEKEEQKAIRDRRNRAH